MLCRWLATCRQGSAVAVQLRTLKVKQTGPMPLRQALTEARSLRRLLKAGKAVDECQKALQNLEFLRSAGQIESVQQVKKGKEAKAYRRTPVQVAAMGKDKEQRKELTELLNEIRSLVSQQTKKVNQLVMNGETAFAAFVQETAKKKSGIPDLLKLSEQFRAMSDARRAKYLNVAARKSSKSQDLRNREMKEARPTEKLSAYKTFTSRELPKEYAILKEAHGLKLSQKELLKRACQRVNTRWLQERS